MKGKMKVIPHLSMEMQLCDVLGKHAALGSITVRVKTTQPRVVLSHAILDTQSFKITSQGRNEGHKTSQKTSLSPPKTDAEDANRLHDKVQFLRTASNNLLALL